MFKGQWNLTTHFLEYIPVVKQRMTVIYFKNGNSLCLSTPATLPSSTMGLVLVLLLCLWRNEFSLKGTTLPTWAAPFCGLEQDLWFHQDMSISLITITDRSFGSGELVTILLGLLSLSLVMLTKFPGLGANVIEIPQPRKESRPRVSLDLHLSLPVWFGGKSLILFELLSPSHLQIRDKDPRLRSNNREMRRLQKESLCK